MEILEKVAYMKGLAEGLSLDPASKEGKLFNIMMDIIEDVALEMQDMRTDQEDLMDGLNAVSDDLSDVESRLYELSDEVQEHSYQAVCPNCDEDISFDESVLEEGCVQCPNCGRQLEFDLDECFDEDDFDETDDDESDEDEDENGDGGDEVLAF